MSSLAESDISFHLCNRRGWKSLTDYIYKDESKLNPGPQTCPKVSPSSLNSQIIHLGL